MRRFVCHACKATYDDVDRLNEPSSARYMFFVPHLEVTDG